MLFFPRLGLPGHFGSYDTTLGQILWLLHIMQNLTRLPQKWMGLQTLYNRMMYIMSRYTYKTQNLDCNVMKHQTSGKLI